MAWYSVGTVAVTNGSATVTGSNTQWDPEIVLSGDAFLGPDGAMYEISAVNSATQITLARTYGGSNGSGQSYEIVPTRHTGRQQYTAVKDLIQTVHDKVDPLDDWQAARQAEIDAAEATLAQAWRPDNDGAGSGLDADLLDGKHASDFTLENPGNYREVFMGSYHFGSTNTGIKRFNFKLLGMGDVSVVSASFRIDLRGYVYQSGKACDFTFVGYNHVSSGSVINSQSLDRSGHGFACSVTRIVSGVNKGVWVWAEVSEYHFNAGVFGTRVQPGLAFDPAAGFQVVKTDQGVAVT